MAADNAIGWKMGDDILKLNDVEVVEVDTGETILAGQLLIIKGVNATRLKVGVAGAGQKARFVAAEAGGAGDIIQGLRRGKTKATAGGTVTAGDAIKAGALGKFVAAAYSATVTSGSTTVLSTSAQPTVTLDATLSCGFTYQDGADTEKGLIWFDGGN